MKFRNIILATPLALALTAHAETISFSGGGSFDLGDETTYIDASAAYASDSSNFTGSINSGNSTNSFWGASDGSDSAWFVGGSSFEGNAGAPGIVTWTLTGLDAGASYNLSGLTLTGTDGGRINERGISIGLAGESRLDFQNSTIASWTLGNAGPNDNYDLYLFSFADDVVDNGSGEISIDFAKVDGSDRGCLDGIAVTAVAIPEPSTTAVLFSFVALGAVAVRRRRNA